MDKISIGFLVGVAFAVIGVVFYRILRVDETTASKLGKKVADRTRTDPGFAARVEAILGGKLATSTPAAAKPAAPVKPAKPTGESLRLLGILQSEARLVDFLLENILQVDDATLVATSARCTRRPRPL